VVFTFVVNKFVDVIFVFRILVEVELINVPLEVDIFAEEMLVAKIFDNLLFCPVKTIVDTFEHNKFGIVPFVEIKFVEVIFVVFTFVVDKFVNEPLVVLTVGMLKELVERLVITTFVIVPFINVPFEQNKELLVTLVVSKFVDEIFVDNILVERNEPDTPPISNVNDGEVVPIPIFPLVVIIILVFETVEATCVNVPLTGLV
jgi:hypothetical protein